MAIVGARRRRQTFHGVELQFFGPLIGVAIVLALARWWFAASATG